VKELQVYCFFVSDLHGKLDRYDKLFAALRDEAPGALFMGGDLLPHVMRAMDRRRVPENDFVRGFFARKLRALRDELAAAYPRVLIILGNDDARVEEEALRREGASGLWELIHGRRVELEGRPVFGYSHCPPTPFQLKDWERYDVSRFVDPGCVSPEEGSRSVPITEDKARYATIKGDLEALVGDEQLSRAVFLFHSPPYQTKLDRAALDGKMVDHAPIDVHVGSIAMKRFIEARQPWVTLHGHVHESARITGSWRDRIGATRLFTAAHDGPELALLRFDLDHPEEATRELI
jgi:uncharacterized protein